MVGALGFTAEAGTGFEADFAALLGAAGEVCKQHSRHRTAIEKSRWGHAARSAPQQASFGRVRNQDDGKSGHNEEHAVNQTHLVTRHCGGGNGGRRLGWRAGGPR